MAVSSRVAIEGSKLSTDILYRLGASITDIVHDDVLAMITFEIADNIPITLPLLRGAGGLQKRIFDPG